MLIINIPPFMQFQTCEFPGLVECLPTKYPDERGHFYESYNQKKFSEIGISENFVQDNFSYSLKGVIRGLHFQHNPKGQGKLVRCMTGSVMDVVVDLRKDSPTFGKHKSIFLNAELGNMLYIPVGFAHGFIALEKTIFVYKCTEFWNKESEDGIRFDDPSLNIQWGEKNPIVSAKDLELPLFDPNKSYF